MKKLIPLLVLLLAGQAWGQDTIGNPSIASVSAASVGTDSGYGFIANSGLTYTASSGDAVTEMWVYARDLNGNDSFALAIYTVDGSGDIDSLMDSVRVQIDENGGTPQWYSATGLSISLVGGEDYTIAFVKATANSGFSDCYTSANGSGNQISFTNNSGIANPWVESFKVSGTWISLYAVVENTAPATTITIGPTVIGPTVVGP